MTNYTKEKITEILREHQLWIDGEDGGVRASLGGANLDGANLGGANLYRANLVRASLYRASLDGASLDGASLDGANLDGVRSYNGCSGNMSEVKSIQFDYWPVTYTHEVMQIGCQLHKIEEWWGFSDEEIGHMDSRAQSWWAIWKPILKIIIEASPALPSVRS